MLNPPELINEYLEDQELLESVLFIINNNINFHYPQCNFLSTETFNLTSAYSMPSNLIRIVPQKHISINM